MTSSRRSSSTSSSRRFLLRLAILLAICWAVVFVLVLPQYTENFAASWGDKMDLLAETEGPRLLLVGDSNVAYGIDSTLLEEETGLAVINMGLHGGLCQAWYIDMIRGDIHAGDIIVLLPERYDSENAYENISPPLSWIATEGRPDLRVRVKPGFWKEQAAAFPTYLNGAVRRFLTNSGNENEAWNGSYARQWFDAHGDNVYPRPDSWLNLAEPYAYFQSGPLSPAMAAYWNDFAAECAEKGATLLMGVPPVCEPLIGDTDLDAVQKSLEEGLDFPVISKLSDYRYGQALFYDTGMHLTDTGRDLRTRQLLIDLRPYVIE